MSVTTAEDPNKAKKKHAMNKPESGFDFDQWAVQVRRQMMASLRKRGLK